jgi:hypothetical protein
MTAPLNSTILHCLYTQVVGKQFYLPKTMLHNSSEFWINPMWIVTSTWRVIKHVQWNIHNMLCFTWKDFLLFKIHKYANHSEAAVVQSAHVNCLWLFPLTCVCFTYLWFSSAYKWTNLVASGLRDPHACDWVCNCIQKQFSGCLLLKHSDPLYLTILLFFTSLRREQTTLLRFDDVNRGHNTSNTQFPLMFAC